MAHSHQRVREASRRAIFERYAAVQGIEMRFADAAGKTDLALGVLEELTGDPLPYVQAAFRAYWRDHLDLDDEATVGELIRSSGASHSGDLTTSRATLAAVQAQAEASGIADTPAYVITKPDGDSLDVFIGREHLPWVEQLLRARLRA